MSGQKAWNDSSADAATAGLPRRIHCILECPPGDRAHLDQPIHASEGRMCSGNVNGGRSRVGGTGIAEIAETLSETACQRRYLAGHPGAPSKSKAVHVFSHVDQLFGGLGHA